MYKYKATCAYICTKVYFVLGKHKYFRGMIYRLTGELLACRHDRRADSGDWVWRDR